MPNQTKLFHIDAEVKDFQNKLNTWVHNHPTAEIVDIKLTSHYNAEYHVDVIQALILYKEAAPDA